MAEAPDIKEDVGAQVPDGEHGGDVVTVEALADPQYYLDEVAKMLTDSKNGAIDELAFQRKIGSLDAACQAMTGMKLKELRTNDRSGLGYLEEKQSLLENSEDELDAIEASINSISELDVKKKARWIKAIGRARKIQRRAREDTLAFMIYLGRDSEEGAIFKPAFIHKHFFSIWANPAKRNTLSMAPPSTGKSTCLRFQILHLMAKTPQRRFLLLYDTEEKAEKEITTLKAYINSGRFHALYPDVRVARNIEGYDQQTARLESSRRRFTLERENWGSREPSVEGAAVDSAINGNGYDIAIVDDPCPAEVAEQARRRQRINEKWDNVVEQRLRNPATATIIMVCTPWHPNDLAGKIQREVRENLRQDWAIQLTPIEDDDDGNPISLWPDRFDTAYYAEKRSRMTASSWARLFQLKCIAEEDRIVKKLHFYPAEKNSIWERSPALMQGVWDRRLKAIYGGQQWLSIDPSATSGKASTDTAITQLSMTATGSPFIVDVWFFPGNPVEMQEWLVSAITKIVPADKTADIWNRLPKTRLDGILFEAQGPITGQITLWIDFIRRRLKELDFKGHIDLRRTLAKGVAGSRTAVNKERRLRNTAAFLENGLIQFPGRVVMQDGQAVVAMSARENIIKLCNQILDFPSGLADGVDTITQFIIENESRIARENTDAPKEGVGIEQWDTMVTGKAKILDRLRKPPSADEWYSKEEAWLCHQMN
jgi:hypothetical protein